MKLVTIADERGGRPGLLHQDSIFDLRAGHPSLSLSGWRPDSVVAVMNAGEAGRDHLVRLTNALAHASAGELSELRSAGVLLPVTGTRLAPPIRRSGLIVSVEQSEEGLPQPFIKSANTLKGPDQKIVLPEHLGGQTSAIGQIAAVLARPGHRVTAADVHGAIGGYLLALDLTHQSEPVGNGHDAGALMARGLGKQLPGFYPIGPFLVSADEVDGADVDVNLAINGVSAARWSAVDVMPRVHEAIIWLSRYFSFKPGDVVALGATGIAGAVIGPGDAIQLQSNLLGELSVQVGS